MLIVYVDESGDPSGLPSHGGSDYYCLGCVVVRDAEWADAFDGLLNLRRQLTRGFAIPARAEIKASHLVRNDGVFGDLRLSPKQRRYIYRSHLRRMGVTLDQDATTPTPLTRAFAIHIDKRQLAHAGGLDSTRWWAWESLFQRLTLMHDRDDPKGRSPVLLVHDEGEDLTIRKYARRARRFLTSGSAYGTGSLTMSDRWLIDDPVSRQSHHSLFVQCADLVAYAAAKRIQPGGARSRRVCPPTMWDELGPACFAVVNRVARQTHRDDPPGIVRRNR